MSIKSLFSITMSCIELDVMGGGKMEMCVTKNGKPAPYFCAKKLFLNTFNRIFYKLLKVKVYL